MSEADLMFKQLGYDLEKDDWEVCVYRDSGNEDLYIRFDKRYRVIMGSPTYDYFCDMPLLVAMNTKVKEMGWLQ